METTCLAESHWPPSQFCKCVPPLGKLTRAFMNMLLAWRRTVAILAKSMIVTLASTSSGGPSLPDTCTPPEQYGDFFFFFFLHWCPWSQTYIIDDFYICIWLLCAVMWLPEKDFSAQDVRSCRRRYGGLFPIGLPSCWRKSDFLWEEIVFALIF